VSHSITLDARQQELLQQAAAWRLLGLLFECPSPAWRRHIRALAREVHERGLRMAAYAALKQAGEGLYHSTFGPGGPAPCREAACRPAVELGSLLADLEGFYQAFGYQPRNSEPPDHVAIETGFVSFLCLKQAYAIATGNQEAAEVTCKAAGRFVQDHLQLLAGPLAAALHHAPISYLRLAGEELCRRTGARPEALAAPSSFPILDSTFDCAPFLCLEDGRPACHAGPDPLASADQNR
jgi:nitrate reductase assembly molybdenum cofactor insertion protein NarJ